MTTRFRTAPPWAKRVLTALYLAIYLGLVVAGVIGTTWPADSGMTTVELVAARGAGVAMIVGAALCWASYPTRRWRWELRWSWVAGTALGVYTLVIFSHAPLADRGLLVVSMLVLTLSVFARGVAMLTFEDETRRAAEAAIPGE
ncbi:MAG: hypothetical protein ACYC1Z_03340 [Georgenia sp.]